MATKHCPFSSALFAIVIMIGIVLRGWFFKSGPCAHEFAFLAAIKTRCLQGHGHVPSRGFTA